MAVWETIENLLELIEFVMVGKAAGAVMDAQ